MSVIFFIFFLLLFVIIFEVLLFVRGFLDNDIVKNWIVYVEGYFLKFVEEGLKMCEFQKLYDSVNYIVEEKSGFDMINFVKLWFGNYFVKKENIVRVGCIFFQLFKFCYNRLIFFFM